jgi:hypothetical protein
VNGNIALDPIFCDLTTGNLRIRSDSPCAPRQSPGCGLLGAWPVGCFAPQDVISPDPAGFAVSVFPNPFTDRTTIRWTSPDGDATRISIFDPSGREIRWFTPSPAGGPGSLCWDGGYEDGSRAPAGIYFVRVGAAHETRCVRVTRIQ